MRFAVFAVPYNAPGRSPYEITEWNLQVIRWADELGFAEAWIAEHYTIGWEAFPAPELIIAAGLRETTQITFAPGAHLLPYHHPVSLAHRIAWLDHMAQGRYLLGIGAGAFALDHKLFDTTPSRNAAMMIEALDIMLKLWTADGPFKFVGDFWSVDYPEFTQPEAGPHLKPFQLPHPPIAIAGTSPKSPTLALGGARNFEPMSLITNPAYLASHWDGYSQAALEAGHVPDRSKWRLSVEFMVADTDDEALRLVEDGFFGRYAREYLVPKFGRDGFLEAIAPGVPPEALTPEWFCRNIWLVGSPQTVTERIREIYEQTGGFGTLLLQVGDYSDQPDAYRHCLELVSQEVMPAVRDLVPAGTTTHAADTTVGPPAA